MNFYKLIGPISAILFLVVSCDNSFEPPDDTHIADTHIADTHTDTLFDDSVALVEIDEPEEDTRDTEEPELIEDIVEIDEPEMDEPEMDEPEIDEVVASFTRYSSEELMSPISGPVIDSMHSLYGNNELLNDNVFMKVGASGTVTSNFLNCFAGEGHIIIDLDGREQLWGTIEYFRSGEAGGSTPFDRETIAAAVGRTAAWVISGSPSPLDQELEVLNPRFAFINYGTNDMNMGTTHSSALRPFYLNYSDLMDYLEEYGVIPIVSGINPRGDSIEAVYWVNTYNTVIRGMAEARQWPYINLYIAVNELENHGLLSDGLHGNVFVQDGFIQPCIFTEEGLQYNYNVRNLATLNMLDQVKRSVIDFEPGVTAFGDYQGQGTRENPFIIDRLPFTHFATTENSSSSEIQGYPVCDRGQDESGPEYFYWLELEETTALRMIVLDREGVDIDIHLLEGEGQAENCVERHDQMIERTLSVGNYIIVLDTYVQNGNPQAGEFLFTITPCDPEDQSCD